MGGGVGNPGGSNEFACTPRGVSIPLRLLILLGLLRGIDAVVNRFERVAEVRLGGRRFPAADSRGQGWGQRKSPRAERSRRAQCDHSHIPLFCDLALLINLRASGRQNGTDREPIQEVAMSLTDWNEVAVHSLLADADLILKFFTAETSGDNSEEILAQRGASASSVRRSSTEASESEDFASG